MKQPKSKQSKRGRRGVYIDNGLGGKTHRTRSGPPAKSRSTISMRFQNNPSFLTHTEYPATGSSSGEHALHLGGSIVAPAANSTRHCGTKLNVNAPCCVALSTISLLYINCIPFYGLLLLHFRKFGVFFGPVDGRPCIACPRTTG